MTTFNQTAERPHANYNLASNAETYNRTARAIVDCDNLRNAVDRLLTWSELDYETRAQFTQAANALDLASYCLRKVGPGKAVSIGF